MLSTDNAFSMLEDETAIIGAANAPALETMKLFAWSEGQHEHPPLYDLLLHFWIPIAGVNPTLLRIPSMLLYAASLVVLALIARKVAGDVGFLTTLAVGALWPFGFLFGRLAGWYSFCLFLIALLTLAYVRWLESPNWSRWAVVLITATALVWSNYYGWAAVGLLGIDAMFSRAIRSRLKFMLVGAFVLVAGYAPLWTAFLHEIHASSSGPSGTLRAKALNTVFGIYTLFVSESIAPWFWQLSLVTGAAIVIALICTFLLTNGQSRRLLVEFSVLFLAMAVIGIISTKRLLFISGWLIVALGCALAKGQSRRTRIALVTALVVIAVSGWTGIISGKHYATAHFAEPWRRLADEAAVRIGSGQTVVSNSPSFLFYLNSSLYQHGLSNNAVPGWAENPRLISLLSRDTPEFRFSGQVFFVRGVNMRALQPTVDAEDWLVSHCQRESTHSMVPEPGFDLKKKYFGSKVGRPYRITTEEFGCGTEQPATKGNTSH